MDDERCLFRDLPLSLSSEKFFGDYDNSFSWSKWITSSRDYLPVFSQGGIRNVRYNFKFHNYT